MNATYNITNNRLFFWPEKGQRLPEDKYQAAKKAGFMWWPRGCFTAVWSTQAEDFILSMGLTIEEDDTPDNIEKRVERYQNYAANDTQAAENAENRLITGAAHTARQINQAEGTLQKKTNEAEYWHRRIAGAISRAEYRDRPDVISRRIKGIEADLRKYKKNADRNSQENKDRLNSFIYDWKHDHGYSMITEQSTNEKGQIILSSHWNQPMSEEDKKSALQWALDQNASTLAHYERWVKHTEMRLEYERAYLKAAGGAPEDNITLEVGQQVGAYTIAKVNKTTVLVKTNWGYMKMDKSKAALMAQREAQS